MVVSCANVAYVELWHVGLVLPAVVAALNRPGLATRPYPLEDPSSPIMLSG